ncbi:hypothetical protein K491DRAFT_769630 [Lophiostoma macrostomum CBS 122681]|uniref:Transcription factor Iwr1 domain-containing protein n=1 Tax=Lophiostoma macrostomum CBS 122681 TaxID=1314788 RepID=A0A6A6T2S3_9PLEO|nr:hypothetical protein K491DRAFT_769630 [Lophiostoma macrostomum CBS 122681]
MNNMSRNAPQTLLVKRKRGEASVDALIVERNDKRLKSEAFPSSKRKLDDGAVAEDESHGKRVKGDSPGGTVVWKRIKAPHRAASHAISDAPPQTPTRRFHVSRSSGNVILFENRASPQTASEGHDDGEAVQASPVEQPGKNEAQSTSAPRKRPGASTALKGKLPQTPQKASGKEGPSEETIRQFQAFSHAVEKDDLTAPAPRPSPSKFTPKAPKLRFKDRHPEQAAALRSKDPNSMDVDTDDYVYDTYVREIMLPDADGQVPEPEGTVGFIVISEEDEEWWFGDDESDKEFDTDEEDENAEDYYGNDYPEDELSSDDEFERDPYSYYHGDDKEEYGVDSDEERAGSGEEEVEAFSQGVPKPRAVFWGKAGE